VDSHLLPLTDDWALWRDFAVRSAGFPVSGLEVFGPGDEHVRLQGVARDGAFREAVTWQSREALASAVDKLAGGVTESPARQRRREDVVASYWQRYCAKNDTIGFFGPLAWGRCAEEGPAVAVRAGGLVRECVVHLEVWAVEALARAVGLETVLPMGPYPERDLRDRLTRHPDPQVRERGLVALDRLEAARQAVADAGRDGLLEVMIALDSLFQELAGRPAVWAEGDADGGRTVAYLDCMRDLDMTLGPGVLAELRATLPALLASSRWWCGAAYAAGKERLERIAGAHGPGPLAPMLGELADAAWGLFGELDAETAELQRRWNVLLSAGDDATISARAATMFADHRPAWPLSVYHSADLQIAAPSTEAVEQGDFLIVLGDFHGGSNPLVQGIFSRRHPDPDALNARLDADITGQVVAFFPRVGAARMTARLFPSLAARHVHVTSGSLDAVPQGVRGISVGELSVADGYVSDQAGSFRASLADLLWGPIFISAVRSFDPFGGRAGRVTVGRTVLRRAQWRARPVELPQEAAALQAWARDRGLPRRLFVRSPLERKPIYVDLESQVLPRVLARFLKPVAERAPEAPILFTEMLPGPDECWLRDANGSYTSELRVVAVDRTPRAS
jgi:hypothetical protein